MTLLGTDPTAFRLVAQCLNQLYLTFFLFEPLCLPFPPCHSELISLSSKILLTFGYAVNQLTFQLNFFAALYFVLLSSKSILVIFI